ncbi:MAG TPA: T9SS type A sorting domain-containing protein, partial [Chitinophagaceae bacterium]|nr:T9SS type A sorting domain-containing protein [Chitinophagaceae bacterium]
IATPLPVQLTSFTGTSLESYDRLNWRTSCELNSSHFNLQYSANGKDFNTISVIPSRAVNGNCQEALEYSTENRDVQNGHNYYRLEQVDLDGHSTFCGEVIDLQRASANSSLSVFPNPCYNQLNITLNSKQNDMVQLYITDMRGEKVWQKSVPVQNGLNTVKAALHPLSSGMYILHAHTRDEQFTRKFEKK